MWQHVASLVADWGAELVGERGLSSVGAVVGATHPRAVGEARKLMPQAILLLPGVGAQGGDPADLAGAFTSGPASALVTASRSMIYASRESGDDFRALQARRPRRCARSYGPSRAGRTDSVGPRLRRMARDRASALRGVRLERPWRSRQ